MAKIPFIFFFNNLFENYELQAQNCTNTFVILYVRYLYYGMEITFI